MGEQGELRQIGSIRRPDDPRRDRQQRRQRVEAFLREPAERSEVAVGVDLGKMSDFTAVVVSERERRDDGVHHVLRSVERLPLGTPYPQIADRVAEVIRNLWGLSQVRESDGHPGLSIELIVDASGVGAAVVDLFHERGMRPVPVTIVAGSDVKVREDRSIVAGKSHLVGTLDVLLQTGRLHFPDAAEADILEHELVDYQRDYTPSGNVTWSARSGRHDDLVLAACLAVAIELPLSVPFIVSSRKVRGRW